jgi:hypothetical protein
LIIYFKKSLKVTQSPRVPRVTVATPLEWLLEKLKATGHPWKLFFLKIEFYCPTLLEPMASGCPFQSGRVQESAIFFIHNYFLVDDPYDYTI